MTVASANKSNHRRRFHISSRKRLDLDFLMAASSFIEKKSSQRAPFELADFITCVVPTEKSSHSVTNFRDS
jgi:hypothetical protein